MVGCDPLGNAPRGCHLAMGVAPSSYYYFVYSNYLATNDAMHNFNQSQPFHLNFKLLNLLFIDSLDLCLPQFNYLILKLIDMRVLAILAFRLVYRTSTSGNSNLVLNVSPLHSL